MTGKQYTGELRRGDKPGTVTGVLRDPWGWRIEIRGTWNAETRCYDLTGTLGAVPDSLRVAAIDDEAVP